MARPKKVDTVLDAVGLAHLDFTPSGITPVLVPSQLRTLNKALGGGWWTKSNWEIAGAPGSAKSTLALFLASEVPGCELVEVLDTENMSIEPSYYAIAASQSGFRGTVRLTPIADDKGEIYPDTTRVNMLVDTVRTGKPVSVIVDSIASYMPTNETENEIGARNMGSRAFEMRQAISKLNRYALASKAHCGVFYTNHLKPDFGGYGMSTPGGSGKDFGMIYRVRLSVVADKTMPDEVLRITGKVTRSKVKMKGQDDRTFGFIAVPGIGVHVGLTAVLDCMNEGLATKSQGIVSMDGVRYGRFSDMCRDHATTDFAPFIAKSKEII